jgi:hypothetical protein
MDPLAPALDVHDHAINHLADEFLAISGGSRWGSPEGRDIYRQTTNGRALSVGKHTWLLLEKAMIVLLNLLLGGQLLFPGPFQHPGHEPMFRFDRMVLASGSLDFIGSALLSLLPELV